RCGARAVHRRPESGHGGGPGLGVGGDRDRHAPPRRRRPPDHGRGGLPPPPTPASGWWPVTQFPVNTGLTGDRRRRLVDNDVYAAFARRVIAAYGRRIATGDV